MEIKNLIQQLQWHPTRRWSTRDLSAVNKIILHQELGNSTIEQVNAYQTGPNHISKKGCPHFCYHFGIRKNGEIVQANELSQIVWHTRGQNGDSIGIMLVGNFKGPGYELAEDGPSEVQMKAMEWLVNNLLGTFKINKQDVFGHYHFGKSACPGYKVQEWIENFRNDLSDVVTKKPVEKSILEIQKRLRKLGYDTGPLDGVIGVLTQRAIRQFQTENRLIQDGIVGPQTWKKMLQLTEK